MSMKWRRFWLYLNINSLCIDWLRSKIQRERAFSPCAHIRRQVLRAVSCSRHVGGKKKQILDRSSFRSARNPAFLCGDIICDVMTTLQSGDKISKCNQHFLVASKSQGVDKTWLWYQRSKVVSNWFCGVKTSSWCQTFIVLPKFQSGAMSSSEEKLSDDEILAAHKILPLCGQPRLTMMTMKSNYLTRIRL